MPTWSRNTISTGHTSSSVGIANTQRKGGINCVDTIDLVHKRKDLRAVKHQDRCSPQHDEARPPKIAANCAVGEPSASAAAMDKMPTTKPLNPGWIGLTLWISNPQAMPPSNTSPANFPVCIPTSNFHCNNIYSPTHRRAASLPEAEYREQSGQQQRLRNGIHHCPTMATNPQRQDPSLCSEKEDNPVFCIKNW